MMISHNLFAMNSNRMLGIQGKKKGKETEKLSSGYRINRSADDAAGLAISEKMRRQIRGLNQSVQNAQDGISLVQSAEGALHEVHDMLQRMNQLAVQASNGTNSEEDRSYLQEEVLQIINEVDKVAETTTFNEMVLLDGRYSKQTGNTAHTGTISQTGNTIFTYDITYDITDSVAPMHRNSKDANWTVLAADLETEIVPQAVTNLLTTFSKTFGYLQKADIGIGLTMSTNDTSPTVASVTMDVRYDTATTPANIELQYNLFVNMNYVTLNSITHEIDQGSRNYLESVITHEMMHALMMESLTAGMLGRDQNMAQAQAFPLWFIEGTAQAAGGGAADAKARLHIDESSSDTAITNALAQEYLGSGSGDSLYGTGYLATMYLGYVISGGNSMEASKIAAGLDQLMYDVRGGMSLNQAIAKNTRQQYTSIQDFETRFSQDGVVFTRNLLNLSKNGYGALISTTYSSNNILDDTSIKQPVFQLYPDHEVVVNKYKDGYDFLEGGLADTEGIAGAGHPNYTNNSGTGNNGGGTPGTGGGGTGGGGVTPGIGGGGGTGGGGVTPGTGGGGTGGGNAGTAPQLSGGIRLQVGSAAGQSITLHIEQMSASGLGIDQVNISSVQGAQKAIDQIKEAIGKVSEQRSKLGAYQNRLEHTIRNLKNVVENTTAAESQIRDADMAKWMVEYSNSQILLQSSQAMLAQSNNYGELILQLL